MNFLDPVFNPLLALQPIYTILIVSVVLTALLTIAYKFLTNQKLMKELKTEMKSMQKQAKEFSSQPEKASEINKRMMEKNMEYMKQTMRSTLITMLPIILIIGWMSAHLSYDPLFPGQMFNVTVTAPGVSNLTIEAGNLTVIGNKTLAALDGKYVWQVKGDSVGEYVLGFTYGKVYTEKKILISNELNYEQPIEKVKNSPITLIEISHNKLKPLGDFSLFGWQPGWLGIYIIISIVVSTGLRKLMGIH
jgi:uncharacterized membrane protein (DUF106 family)